MQVLHTITCQPRFFPCSLIFPFHVTSKMPTTFLLYHRRAGASTTSSSQSDPGPLSLNPAEIALVSVFSALIAGIMIFVSTDSALVWLGANDDKSRLNRLLRMLSIPFSISTTKRSLQGIIMLQHPKSSRPFFTSMRTRRRQKREVLASTCIQQ